MHSWERLRTRLFTLLLANQFAQFGSGSRVSPPLRFWGLDQMSLGQGVIIHRNCWIHIAAGSRPKGIKLIIGSHTGIGMGATIAVAEKVVLGEHVLLARNVYIADHAHAFSDTAIPIMDQGIDTIKPVSIGSKSWLGQNVVVLPGVAIGEHCVVGANSVVNRSIPDYSIAVGAPARVVKTYNQSTGIWEKAL
jgi:acetyltransferase-like isoleucine patch superfamily enzyme